MSDDDTPVPTPDDSTPAGSDHPFEPSPTDDTTRVDRDPGHPSGAPAADPDAGQAAP